jgi:TPR repeat protein
MKTQIVLASVAALTLCFAPIVRAQNVDEIYASQNIQPLTKELQALSNKAAAGNAKAQFALGQAYETGAAGVRKDVATAMSWYEEAARNGNRSAVLKMRSLGAVE